MKQEVKSLNGFNLQAEEMKCNSCKAITGHILTGKYWTCYICGKQQNGKNNFFSKFFT